jgi:hypothetical protein
MDERKSLVEGASGAYVAKEFSQRGAIEAVRAIDRVSVGNLVPAPSDYHHHDTLRILTTCLEQIGGMARAVRDAHPLPSNLQEALPSAAASAFSHKNLCAARIESASLEPLNFRLESEVATGATASNALGASGTETRLGAKNDSPTGSKLLEREFHSGLRDVAPAITGASLFRALADTELWSFVTVEQKIRMVRMLESTLRNEAMNSGQLRQSFDPNARIIEAIAEEIAVDVYFAVFNDAEKLVQSLIARVKSSTTPRSERNTVQESFDSAGTTLDELEGGVGPSNNDAHDDVLSDANELPLSVSTQAMKALRAIQPDVLAIATSTYSEAWRELSPNIRQAVIVYLSDQLHLSPNDRQRFVTKLRGSTELHRRGSLLRHLSAGEIPQEPVDDAMSIAHGVAFPPDLSSASRRDNALPQLADQNNCRVARRATAPVHCGICGSLYHSRREETLPINIAYQSICDNCTRARKQDAFSSRLRYE